VFNSIYLQALPEFDEKLLIPACDDLSLWRMWIRYSKYQRDLNDGIRNDPCFITFGLTESVFE